MRLLIRHSLPNIWNVTLSFQLGSDANSFLIDVRSDDLVPPIVLRKRRIGPFGRLLFSQRGLLSSAVQSDASSSLILLDLEPALLRVPTPLFQPSNVACRILPDVHFLFGSDMEEKEEATGCERVRD